MQSRSSKDYRALYVLLGSISIALIFLPVLIYSVVTHNAGFGLIPVAALVPGFFFYKVFSVVQHRTPSSSSKISTSTPPSLAQRLLVLIGMLLIGISFFVSIGPLNSILFALGIVAIGTWLLLSYRK